MLVEYARVSIAAIDGNVPDLPPVSPLPETTISGTFPEY